MINLDAVGYKDGSTAFSLYNEDSFLAARTREVIASDSEFIEGEPWVQGDHSMFTMQGIPAIAITSEKFEWLCREITHTELDNISQVDSEKLAKTVLALRDLIESMAERSARKQVASEEAM